MEQQEISLDINLNAKQALQHRLDLARGADEERELNFNEAAGLDWICAEIARLSNKIDNPAQK